MKQIKQALVRLIVSIINAMSKDIEEKYVYQFESKLNNEGYNFVMKTYNEGVDTSHHIKLSDMGCIEVMPGIFKYILHRDENDYSHLADEIEEGYTFEKMKQFIEEGKLDKIKAKNNGTT